MVLDLLLRVPLVGTVRVCSHLTSKLTSQYTISQNSDYTDWLIYHQPIHYQLVICHHQPLSYSLHGLLYVPFLYLDIPPLAILVHLLFMS